MSILEFIIYQIKLSNIPKVQKVLLINYTKNQFNKITKF